MVRDRESLLNETPSKFNIDAIKYSEVLLFDKTTMDRLMAELLVFGKMINEILNKSFITSQNRICDSVSNTAEEIYHTFVERYPAFALRAPQATIASSLRITDSW